MTDCVHFATEAAELLVEEPNAPACWRQVTIVIKVYGSEGWLSLSIEGEGQTVAPIHSTWAISPNDADFSCSLDVQGQIVSLRFLNQVVASNFFRQVSFFQMHAEGAPHPTTSPANTSTAPPPANTSSGGCSGTTDDAAGDIVQGGVVLNGAYGREGVSDTETSMLADAVDFSNSWELVKPPLSHA